MTWIDPAEAIVTVLAEKFMELVLVPNDDPSNNTSVVPDVRLAVRKYHTEDDRDVENSKPGDP